MKIADSSVLSHRSGRSGAQHSFDFAQDTAASLRRMVHLMACAKWCGTGVLLLLLAGVAFAQSHGNAEVANDTREDTRQAQQLAERGDKAFAAGKMNEALADY